MQGRAVRYSALSLLDKRTMWQEGLQRAAMVAKD